jgi:hypothetical protein
MGIALKGRYAGHRLRWFAMRFEGNDDEIDIAANGAMKAEFDDWRWASLEEMLSLAVTFRAGETIWTESSHKFHSDEMFAMAERAGFRVQAQWVDREWPFVESVWAVR